MIIRYDNGYVEDLNPSANLYYNKNIGDKVCLEETNTITALEIFAIMIGACWGIVFGVIIISFLFVAYDHFINDGGTFKEFIQWLKDPQ